uniref:Putative ubiquitin-like protein DSK2 n=1 Tax=Trypanosoma congolense (strain IL3000) TaxID=1068625 RepID=G0UW87_TRYCI|nr:putative ubiquitin-like protein DSK2 [Trypanosoma congolense IL3000]
MSITIKLSNGNQKAVDVPDLSITVARLKELTEGIIEIPVAEQRIVFKGKVLKDTDILSAVGLEHGQAVHVVRGQRPKTQAASLPGSAVGSTTQVPSSNNSSVPGSDAGHNTLNPYMALTGNAFAPSGLGAHTTGTTGPALPPFDGGMAQMMQNPMFFQLLQDMMSNPQFMQQIMQQTASIPGDNTGLQNLLSNPMFMQHAMQLMSNPTFVQRAVQAMSGRAPDPSLFGQANANPADAFQGFGLPQQQGDPRVLYQSQLQQLRDMGFPNEEANIAALRQSQGNIDFAIERLLNG